MVMVTQLILEKAKDLFCLCVVGSFFFGCIEPFDAELSNFESAIVVEATITNELKQQQVFITRTSEEDGPSTVSNAKVRVIGGGTTFVFEEADSGLYMSSQVFAAQPNTSYQLQITTQEGRTYSSNAVLLPPSTQLDALRAERIINDDGADGIAILVDSFDPTGTSVNYRYTYQETYRVIAPEWRPFDIIAEEPSNPNNCEMIKVPRENEERVCYATTLSNGIIQTNTTILFHIAIPSRCDSLCSQMLHLPFTKHWGSFPLPKVFFQKRSRAFWKAIYSQRKEMMKKFLAFLM